MPITDSAAPGDPCWIDLMSSNPELSREFYTKLFGWTAQESGPEYGGYVNFFKNSQPIAGMGTNDGTGGYPDVWTTYLATNDAQATSDAAGANGGQALMPPMQVGDQGTMGMLMGPDGAAVGIWQPDQHRGFGLAAEAGAPVWHELATLDYDAAVPFYRKVFGWETEVMSDTPEFRYTTLGGGEAARAGIWDAKTTLPEGTPSHWQVYFGVEDTDQAVANATGLGATVIRPPEDSPYGRMAVLADPTGAVFTVISVSRAG